MAIFPEREEQTGRRNKEKRKKEQTKKRTQPWGKKKRGDIGG